MFDQTVIECLFDPETLVWGNDLIDIVTAFKRGEITEFEAKVLIFEIRDVRMPEAIPTLAAAHQAVVQAANRALEAIVKIEEQHRESRTKSSIE
jgi:hypothetical protein